MQRYSNINKRVYHVSFYSSLLTYLWCFLYLNTFAYLQPFHKVSELFALRVKFSKWLSSNAYRLAVAGQKWKL